MWSKDWGSEVMPSKTQADQSPIQSGLKKKIQQIQHQGLVIPSVERGDRGPVCVYKINTIHTPLLGD
jgi:hypothetical protein